MIEKERKMRRQADKTNKLEIVPRKVMTTEKFLLIKRHH